VSKIFKNQDYLRIRIYLGCNLSGATILIKYKAPNDLEGSWAITAIEDVSDGIVYKDFMPGETLGISGVWTFWTHVTFPDGRIAPGEPFIQMIYDEGG